MKKLFFINLVIVGFLFACQTNSTKTEANNEQTNLKKDTAKVMVYYFHGKQRCKTCMTVQKVTEETVKKEFANNKDVLFKEVDFSDKANDALAEKYEISFSSLVIASANKHSNITEIAFANAVNNPQVLSDLIIKEVNQMLNQ